MNRIRGKTAVVTGATAGIGEACARSLAEMGVRVVLTARRSDRLAALAADIAAKTGAIPPLVHTLDVRDRAAIDGFMAWLDDRDVAVDILVNNAGLARGLDTVQEGSHDDWDEMIDTNVKGLLNMTRAILPGMIERDSGHVLNLGSIAGHWVYPKGNVYCATKYAVRALTEGTNVDVVGTNVRVSSVDPGLAETEFSVVRFRGNEDRARDVYEGTAPLVAEDIADAVCYVLNTPPHVNVLHLVMMPTVQRSPYVLARES
ncbi:MAG: SDR family NAD(P)-dependent oxidoreductase [Gemmatimonadota bacterium]|nr:SDR family NAD(P)-dependent oxidoreductase [Gemmatimonadota bacterium]MDE2866284.1 SDR family NAD(P)-dependent oxidoreductase [Gemmatimonadota bacterium]MXV94299.1 SDR family NAD(P)-dependent oxidoreductase [Gemmatimonadota bacterium]MYE15219.1 SDR family NAD(P)-dependent oxidoreductase [Gemmatimonadota bacterium]